MYGNLEEALQQSFCLPSRQTGYALLLLREAEQPTRRHEAARFVCRFTLGTLGYGFAQLLCMLFEHRPTAAASAASEASSNASGVAAAVAWRKHC